MPWEDNLPDDIGEQEEPSLEQLQEWLFDGVAEATDGCQVEPDGYCEHGKPSWLILLGYI